MFFGVKIVNFWNERGILCQNVDAIGCKRNISSPSKRRMWDRVRPKHSDMFRLQIYNVCTACVPCLGTSGPIEYERKNDAEIVMLCLQNARKQAKFNFFLRKKSFFFGHVRKKQYLCSRNGAAISEHIALELCERAR